MKARQPLDLRRKVLLFAGLGSCLMAFAHALIPTIYGWQQYLGLVPRNLAWAVIAASFACCFVLLWGGCMTVLAAVRSTPISKMSYAILYGLGTFWALYVLYQAEVPPPMPDSTRVALLAGAAVIACLYLLFLLTRGLDARKAKDLAQVSRAKS